jgi:hypothetical protein
MNKTYKRWTEAEEKIISECYSEYPPNVKKAMELLGRSSRSIHCHALMMGVTTDFRRPKNLSEIEINFIKNNYKSKTPLEISKEIGTTPYLVKKEMKILSLPFYKKVYEKKVRVAKPRKEKPRLVEIVIKVEALNPATLDLLAQKEIIQESPSDRIREALRRIGAL